MVCSSRGLCAIILSLKPNSNLVVHALHLITEGPPHPAETPRSTAASALRWEHVHEGHADLREAAASAARRLRSRVDAQEANYRTRGLEDLRCIETQRAAADLL